MADFFGGILDDLRGYAKDVGSFFDSSIGRAAASGVAGGYGMVQDKNGNYVVPEQQRQNPDYISTSAGGGRSTGSVAPLQSEDFSAAELRWLSRMKSFANLDTGTSVKLGSK